MHGCELVASEVGSDPVDVFGPDALLNGESAAIIGKGEIFREPARSWPSVLFRMSWLALSLFF